MHSRRYSAFISYRHVDNTQEGRRWAEWLHRGLERYTVPPDLIGTPNLRGEPIRDSLYPIFRDEDELPANRDQNREAADHLWAKLRTIGYSLRPAPEDMDSPPKPDPALLEELIAREEELARAEHYRWVTAKVLAGWQAGKDRTSAKDIAAGKPKIHPDIRPYEDLDESTKEKDRVNIRAIPALLREGRLIATK